MLCPFWGSVIQGRLIPYTSMGRGLQKTMDEERTREQGFFRLRKKAVVRCLLLFHCLIRWSKRAKTRPFSQTNGAKMSQQMWCSKLSSS